MLPPSFAVIPCLFYFSILVQFVYSHVIIQLFYFCYCLYIPVSVVIASFGVDCGIWRILFMMLFMIVCIFWLSFGVNVVVLLSAPCYWE